MSVPLRPWETTLQNNGHILKSSSFPQSANRSVPVLPPRPMAYNSGYNSYSPFSSPANGLGYGGYGGMSGMPYRSSMYGGYNSYGGYGSGYGMNGMGSTFGMGSAYGMGSNYGTGQGFDAESRFVQFAEDRSRNTFANVESIVQAFNSMAMMMDNTFFAMTSSFRAILSVAANFGRLRSTFGHIWHALNIFRLVKWMYRKLMQMAGLKVAPSTKSLAWNEAMNGAAAEAAAGGSSGTSWSTIAFLGMILSAPYIISKFLPKFEDKLNPELWKSSGIPAKAVFAFASHSPNELSVQVNDELLLAPKAIQEEMKLTNSGWAFATCNGRVGVVPLNYITINKKVAMVEKPIYNTKVSQKPARRVSFGENQIFEMKDDMYSDKKEDKESTSEQTVIPDTAQTNSSEGIPQ